MIKVVICDDHPVVREGMEIAGSTRLSAVILDISLPGSNGLDVLKDLASRRITVPVLILSRHPEGPVRAAGAAPGSRWLPAQGQSNARGDRRPAQDGLRGQVHQPGPGRAAGRGVRARTRGFSPSTVGSHRTRLLAKLGLRTGADLVRFAVENQLLE